MKIAFSIQEVSELTGVPAHTIRFWEKDFREYIRPAKTPGGQRRYCARDIEMIKMIRRLRYQDKYTVSGTLNEIGKMSRKNADGKWLNGTPPNNQTIQEIADCREEHEEMRTPVPTV